MSHLITFLILVSSLFSLSFQRPAVPGDVKFTVADPAPAYVFGQQVTFQISLQSDVPIRACYLSYQSEGQSIHTQEISVDPAIAAGRTSIITYTLQLSKGMLRPFSTVSYWFQVKTGDQTESVVPSPHYSFFYEDNRFNWQTLTNDHFTIHWVDGDMAFVQEVQNSAQDGLTEIQNLIPVNLPDHPIHIYVYSHAADLQSALDLSLPEQSGNVTWVAGNASPDLGVVMVSIPPGMDQRLSMDQQIPHELAHVLTYQFVGANYPRLPVWLTEGVASMAELYPNSDYAYALEVAAKENNLIPVADLCHAFPHDAAGAFLAYAEADSFSHFLYTNYGATGMEKLIKQYADGLGCSEGATAALGTTLNELEYRWKQDALQLNMTGLVVRKLLPYIILAGLILSIPLISLFVVRKRK